MNCRRKAGSDKFVLNPKPAGGASNPPASLNPRFPPRGRKACLADRVWHPFLLRHATGTREIAHFWLLRRTLLYLRTTLLLQANLRLKEE